MADVKKIAPFIIKWEGGFVNDTLDSGGATMKGITIATYTAYRKSKGLPTPTVNDLKNISDKEWMDILKSNYWDKWEADEIKSQAIANLLVGWGWGSGPVTAIKEFQKLMKLQADGIVGKMTLSAINSANEVELFNKIWLARKDFFVNIIINRPTQIKFLAGWLNRLYDNVLYNFTLIKK